MKVRPNFNCSRYSSARGSCEEGNEHVGSSNGGNVLGRLNTLEYKLPKELLYI